MAWTKTRETTAALVAIVLIIVFAAIGSAIMGWNIPGLSNIAKMLGMGGQ